MKNFIVLSLIVAFTFCWSQTNKIRKCQTSNCQVCSSIGVCVMCHPGHILSINKQTMVSQCVQQKCNIKNCFRCVNQNICAQCQTGFTMNFMSQCVKDNLLRSEVQNRDQFCKKKSKEGDCLECFPGLELIQGKCLPGFFKLQSVEQTTCTPTIQNCTACLIPNFCTNCSTGLVPSADGTNCIVNCSLTIANCLLCSSGLNCSTCQNGYTLINNTCVQGIITGCKTYDIDGTCLNCYQQYQLINNTCQFYGCQYPCLTCNNSVGNLYAPNCSACVSPFNQVPLINGTCFTCNASNCINCSSPTNTTCQGCIPGYTVVQGACVLQSQCFSGYVTINNTCTPCINSTVCLNCSSTNTSICLSCMQGYYLSNGSCIACIQISCAICSNATANLGQCISYQNSTGFLPFTFQNNNITQAYVCDVGCLNCAPNFPMQCLQCQSGFYIAINATSTIAQCFPCAPQCMTCLANNPNICLTCYANAVFVSQKNNCTICNATSNCLTCQTNTTICTSCPPGFGLIFQVCLPCPINCQTCFNQSGTNLLNQNNDISCSSCNPGFGLSVTGYCLPCLYNCRVCSGQFQETCISCGLNFYLNSSNFCIPCPIGCTTCVPTGCLACGENFILVSNGTSAYCTVICPFPCSSCSLNNASICNTCLLGYNLVNGTCVVNINNQTINSVVYCGFGSVFDINTSTCQPCLNNCSRCSQPKLCTSCKYGYYLNLTNNNGSCLPCAPGCKTCSSLSNCVSCQTNYTLVNLSSISNQPYCSQCALPCLQCTQNTQQCLSCIQGFTYTGFNCISNFYYYFTIGLLADNTTFYNNYQPFMSRIQYALSTTNLRSALITTLLTNNASSYVEMNLTTIIPSGTDLATYEFNNLQFALMNQETFGNMLVINNSLQAVNGFSPTLGSNVPMICGIVIPIGVVLIVGLVYCMFSRNNIDLPGSNYIPLDKPSPARMTELRPIE